MDRNARILNHNKRNVSKIVSRKPSSSEGHNGDIYLGYTSNGMRLFTKTNNRWHEFHPRQSAKNSGGGGGTYKGGSYFLHTYNHAGETPSQHHFWMSFGRSPDDPIGGVDTVYENFTHSVPGITHAHRFFAYWNSQVTHPEAGGIEGSTLWRDQYHIPYFLNDDVRIKGIYGKQFFRDYSGQVEAAAGGNPPVNIDPEMPMVSSIFIYELPNRQKKWDDEAGDWVGPGSPNQYNEEYVKSELYPPGVSNYDSENSETFVDMATARIDAKNTMFSYDLNTERIYRKGSHIAMRVMQKYPTSNPLYDNNYGFPVEETDNDILAGTWMIHLEVVGDNEKKNSNGDET